MKNECPKYFEIIQDYFKKHFSIFMDEYKSRIDKKTLLIQSKTDEKILKNHVLEISIENVFSQREIFFRFSEGPNAARTISNHITFEIKNTSPSLKFNRNNFFIGDFCEFYGIEVSEPSFYETTGESYSLEKFKKYIDAVKSIIENTNLKEIIEGKIWIDIPINMKPYK